MHELRRAGEPVAMIDSYEELNRSNRQQGQECHKGEADIERPEAGPQEPLVPDDARLQPAQTEEHEPNAEHAVHTEERGMAMQGRQVQTLHVIERERRVDEKAKESCAHEVPESNGDEEEDRPAIATHPGG